MVDLLLSAGASVRAPDVEVRNTLYLKLVMAVQHILPECKALHWFFKTGLTFILPDGYKRHRRARPLAQAWSRG